MNVKANGVVIVCECVCSVFCLHLPCIDRGIEFWNFSLHNKLKFRVEMHEQQRNFVNLDFHSSECVKVHRLPDARPSF